MSSLKLPLSAIPSSGSTSMPAVTEPSGATVIEKDFRAPAARRSLSVQLALGGRNLKQRPTHHAAHPGAAISSFFVISADDGDPTRGAGSTLERARRTVLPTPRRPVMSIDCSG